ncbi:MAG: hypothetical protein HRU29_10975 [Rhizobiales bacterium]|nr:hypothetical protein [Hyphomicrobiales bacterium]NRB14916.1 hypothetical protein [Hyphomicrobiales bacterium]
MQIFRTKLIIPLLLTASLAACTTTGISTNYASSGLKPAGWQVDSVVAKCVASVIGGTILGGILGAITGRGNQAAIAKGAVVGLAIGGSACAIMTLLDAQDKAQIKNAQILAAKSGKTKVIGYIGKNGIKRKITVKSTPYTVKQINKLENSNLKANADRILKSAGGKLICRKMTTNISYEGKGTTKVTETMCRTPFGGWVPYKAN